jgi:hypothetical protein
VDWRKRLPARRRYRGRPARRRFHCDPAAHQVLTSKAPKMEIRLLVLVLASRERKISSNMINVRLGASCAILSTFVKQRT